MQCNDDGDVDHPFNNALNQHNDSRRYEATMTRGDQRDRDRAKKQAKLQKEAKSQGKVGRCCGRNMCHLGQIAEWLSSVYVDALVRRYNCVGAQCSLMLKLIGKARSW